MCSIDVANTYQSANANPHRAELPPEMWHNKRNDSSKAIKTQHCNHTKPHGSNDHNGHWQVTVSVV